MINYKGYAVNFWHVIVTNSRMKKIFFLFGIVTLFSCNQDEEKNTTEVTDSTSSVKTNDSPPPSNPSARLEPGCYRMIISRDTAEMKISVEGNKVEGDLLYNPFEKDGSFGKFKGEIKDSVIYGGYRFESEGMVSYREVAYMIVPDGLVEGFGDIDMKNDSAWFKYPQTLKFERNHPFVKVACK